MALAPTRGGWAAILLNLDGRTKKIAGPLEGDLQTNNRAELTAVIEGLQAIAVIPRTSVPMPRLNELLRVSASISMASSSSPDYCNHLTASKSTASTTGASTSGLKSLP